ncbi:D-amino-acid transaminase [Sandaracinobacteroides sp. A072]|uniref:D-amino-acid transaminase n=1 Tax=Sandaracinobacteroides sp. A072 TaxID=3461146 RepID=UPI004041AC02
MPALAYVNGRYAPVSDAVIPVEDRGFQFADSVYEVVAFLNGRFLDPEKHLWRLRRNLAALHIEGVAGDAALLSIAKRLVARSRLRDGILYIQVSRGVARRDHPFPAATRPTLVMVARRFDFAQRIAQQKLGVAVISLPEQRWARADLKTTGLLPAVLSKQEARDAGAFEAMLVAGDGSVTEGASTNLWMVDNAGCIRTHPLSARILPGVARDTLMALARADGLRIEERAFTLEEARSAAELFLTSTTAPILPIVSLDGAPVGTGVPGPVAARLAALTWTEISRQTGWGQAGPAA